MLPLPPNRTDARADPNITGNVNRTESGIQAKTDSKINADREISIALVFSSKVDKLYKVNMQAL